MIYNRHPLFDFDFIFLIEEMVGGFYPDVASHSGPQSVRSLFDTRHNFELFKYKRILL